MSISIPHKFPTLRAFTLGSFLFFFILLSQNIWAAQSAMVTADRAVIYADEQMSAPVGYVKKGKKLKVGEIPRNLSQVYPILVSGKVAYIRVIDVSTEKESVDSTTLAAERFQKNTMDTEKTNYSVSYFNFSSQITLDNENTGIKDNDSLNWNGLSIRGGNQTSPKWDLDLLFNYMAAEGTKEIFRAVEFGIGGAFRVYEKSRLKVRLLGQFMAVPFANYSFEEDFRVNGYGLSMGSGLSATFQVARHLGLEFSGGLFYTKISGFESPPPYKEINPSFVGTRLGIGLNYRF